MTISQRILAAFFAFAGTMHFIVPEKYEAIMPPWIPAHSEMVAVSGVAEILGGLALIPAASRNPFARWWLLALLAAVYPANVHMALHPDQIKGLPEIEQGLLYARLPLQFVLAWWVWKATERADLRS